MHRLATTATFLCILLTGCDRKTNDQDVFYQYFHGPAPTNATILKASSSESYGVGLDQWDLTLEAELPREFLDAKLPFVPAGSPPVANDVESLFGDDDLTGGVVEALKDRPPWFMPTDTTAFVVVTNDTRLSFVSGCAVVTFKDSATTNQFQLWISDHGWNRLFVDRQNGHIYARHKFP